MANKKATPTAPRRVKSFAGVADSRPRISDATDLRRKGRA